MIAASKRKNLQKTADRARTCVRIITQKRKVANVVPFSDSVTTEGEKDGSGIQKKEFTKRIIIRWSRIVTQKRKG